MKLPFIYAVVFSIAAALDSATTSYKGHVVLRTVPFTDEQLNFLKNLAASNDDYDFWTYPRGRGLPVDVHVTPVNYGNFLRTLWKMKIPHKVQTSDLEAEINKGHQLIATRGGKLQDSDTFDFNNYNNLETVYSYLRQLANTNRMVSLTSAGTTYEGRDILLVTISTGDDPKKPIIQMDCNIHAREWVTAASCLWFINQLSTGYDIDADITFLLDEYDWVFIPVANPDGYHYTWTNDRLWRKNRAPTSTPNCTGVDPNRNFDANFYGDGVPSSACALNYKGAKPFSEAESIAIKNALLANKARIRAALSIHSYSQLWMSPYGYTHSLPPEYDEMLEVMATAVEALEDTFGTKYKFGNIADTIYIANGTSTDWAYAGAGITHAYAIELRDTGSYGFQLPPNQIEPTALETWNGIKAMAFALLE